MLIRLVPINSAKTFFSFSYKKDIRILSTNIYSLLLYHKHDVIIKQVITFKYTLPDQA